MPEISVVIPYYNTHEWFDECVDSILKQTYQDFDIILIDDYSQPISKPTFIKQAEKDPRIKLLYHTRNMGPSAARNLGIKNSNAKYIVPVDSDNYLVPDALEKFRDAILPRENMFVYSWVKKIGFENRIWEVPDYNLVNLYYNENTIDTCAMFKREHWELIGGYDPRVKYAEDWDFWLNMGAHGITGYLIKEVLYIYRHRKNSLLWNLRSKGVERKKLRMAIRNKYPSLDVDKKREKK